MGLFGRLRAEPVYTTRAVVLRTGVPADTFRAWERRYGLPAPARTEGNQRRYSDWDVATIAWLREQTRAGLTISQAVRLYQTRQVTPTDAAGGAPPERADVALGAGGHMIGYRDEFVDALASFDAVAATRVVAEALTMVPVEDVCLHVLQTALDEIGRRWERGAIGVGAEHFASAFVVRKLGALFDLSQPEQGRGPIVACCPEGELHEVGLLLTCLFLSRRGYRIVYLGANLPLDDLVQAVRRLRPPLVVLSAATPETARLLAAASRELRSRCATPADPRPGVGFGGLVFVERPELRADVDGVFLGRRADEAVEAVDRLLIGVAG